MSELVLVVLLSRAPDQECLRKADERFRACMQTWNIDKIDRYCDLFYLYDKKMCGVKYE